VWAIAEQAEAHRHHGRYDRAEALLRQALTLVAKTDGRDALAVATLSNNLAVVHKYQGRFAEAGRLYRRALRIIVKALGPDHPEGATPYHNPRRPQHARGPHAPRRPPAPRPAAPPPPGLSP